MNDSRDAPIENAKRVARLAYELGRVRWAFVRALPLAIGAFGLATIAGPARANPTMTAASVLAFVVLAGWWRKGACVGAALGVIVGAVPFFAMQLAGTACMVAGRCVEWGAVVCALSGLGFGVAISLWAHARRDCIHIVTGAIAGAGLHVLVGCAEAGVFGGLGLVGGLALVTAPVAVWGRAVRNSAA